MFTYFSSFLQIPYKNEDILYVYLLVISHVILKILFKYPLSRLRMFQTSVVLGLVQPGKSAWREMVVQG